ncbi:MAG TPA: glycosyltransferase [Pyrinomonadaceae bacterium]|jgi:glycosyltransferase involved in cell wall biosynthesis
MKSVHITNYYHKNSGGISTTYNKLLEAANRRQRYVRLIVPGEEDGIEDVGEFGRIYQVKASHSPVFDKRYRIMLPWKTYIFDQAPIKKILRDEKPDMIEIGEKYTISLMAGLLRKHILTIGSPRPMLVHFSCERMDDNVASFITSGRLSRWFCRRFIGAFNLPMFDFHLANSDYTASELFEALSPDKRPHRSATFVNLCWRIFRAPKIALKDRIFVNQCGVDNLTFSPRHKDPAFREKLIAELGVPADSRLLLYAGRISPEKNISLLIDLVTELGRERENNYHLIVAGDGPALDDLRSEFRRRAPNRTTFLGHVGDRLELARLYANADVFVHTNPNEPFGIAPLEALASGVALVAPNAGGVLSYANGDNAWLARPNARSFAAAVGDVFSDEVRRLEKVDNGVQTAAGYTWDASTDALFAIYDEMYARFRSEPEMYDYRKFPREINFAANLTA